MNQSGQTTLDFMFASVLILGTAALIGSLCMALTLTEALQYVSFSGARSHFAAANTTQDMQDAGNAQAAALLKNLPFLSGAQSNEWIKVTMSRTGDFTKSYAQAKSANLSLERSQFVGFQMMVELPLLKIKVPLMGNVMSGLDNEDVTVTVSSFLMREPSFAECVKFNNDALNVLMSRDGRYGQAKAGKFQAINDNGC